MRFAGAVLGAVSDGTPGSSGSCAPHSLIASELHHHALEAVESRVEHWLADEERWDNEPQEQTWEEEALDHGYVTTLMGRRRSGSRSHPLTWMNSPGSKRGTSPS